MEMYEFSEDILSQQDPESINGVVSVTFDDYIAVVHMKCGQNRLNASFVGKMLDALDTVERNEAARVLITIGNGKFYSNGLDLNWLLSIQQQNPEYGLIFRNAYMQKLTAKLLTFPMPTIAVVNGHAFAGGALLAAGHDYSVMNSQRGWFCFNEVHLGLRLLNFTKVLLRMKLGSAFHQALVMGQRFTADEALKHGLAKEICPADQLIACAKRLARTLVDTNQYDRDALKNMKIDIYKPAFDAAQQDNQRVQLGNVFSQKSRL